MTVSSTTRIASFTGNGSASTFAFAFKVFQPSDLLVISQDTATLVNTTLALTTDYTVALNANQDVAPGGSITLTAGPLATGFTLTITSDIPNLQQTEYLNAGGFYPEVLTASLDLLTILVQQQAATISMLLSNFKAKPCVLTTAYTVYTAPGNVAAAFVNGILQPASAYTANGPIINFNYTLDPTDNVDALCTS